MATEGCGICGRVVAFGNTVHLLVHTRSEVGVVDHYVCRDCFEEELETLFD